MDRKRVAIYILRIFFTLLAVGVAAWIFSNSLQDAAQSHEESSTVTEIVQDVVDTITGEEEKVVVSEYFIRKLAHFTEYFLFGASVFCAYRSYTGERKKMLFCLIPVILLPVGDELLQLSSDGRVSSVLDMLLDTGGEVCGFAAAFALFLLGAYIARRVKERNTERQTE